MDDGLQGLTFLMPVYNGMPYLRESIASVTIQGGLNWKLLIVDDGSTDNSWEYIQSARGPNIDVRRNGTNLGLYATINAYVEEITTAWTCLIFQDDLLRPDFLEAVRYVGCSHPNASAIWCAVNTIDSNGHVIAEGIGSNRMEVIEPGLAAQLSVLLRGTFWTISGSVCRTRVLREYKFCRDLPHLGDFDFLLRALRKETFLYYEYPVVDIREHDRQASARHLASLQDIKERLTVVRKHLSILANELYFGFRCRVAVSLCRAISTRGLGLLRRGQWQRALECFALLPTALRTCFFSA